MDPCMQISEVSLKVCRIGLPRQPVHPGGGVALEHEERLPKQIDAEVVEERGELLLLPLLSCLPYASERLGHTSPTLCPVCALLACVPLGPRPWLHRLRRRLPVGPPGSRTRSVCTCQGLRPRRIVRALANGAPVRMAFHIRNCVGTRDDRSFAVQWLACTFPCRRFAGALADVCARLRADVGRYSFTVRDLHPLLLAGLPAHSENIRMGTADDAATFLSDETSHDATSAMRTRIGEHHGS